jgi:hypothetical protein
MAIKTFTSNELRLMPSKSLKTLRNYYDSRKSELLKSLKSVQKKYDNLVGITTIDLGDGTGAVATRLPTSTEGAIDKSKDLAGPMAALSTIVERSGGSVPITNLTKLGVTGDASQAFVGMGDKLDDISAPILQDSLSREQALQAQKALILSKIEQIEGEVDLINDEINKINQVISDRLDGVIEEPIYNIDGLNSEELSDFILSQVIDLTEYQPTVEEEESAFDLDFGPPVSKKGQFILSRDGLYYDSRSGGLPEVVGLIEVAKKWNFKYAPNLGGKGEEYASRDLTQIADTVFDLDFINESSEMKKAYDADLILQELKKDKVKVSYDLSSQIDKLISNGESSTGALVSNLRQSVMATISSFTSKEKKRKKQIEVALFFNVYSYKSGKFFKDQEEINYIPINDFSYLRDVGYSPTLEKQKKLVFDTGDVSDSIYPITPKFLTTPSNAVYSVDEVSLSFGGLGDFVKIDGNAVNSLKPFVKTLGDGLAEDILVGYNFLNPSSVEASSTVKNLDNFAKGYHGLDATLVANSPTDLFPNGLGIPYFYGLTGTSTSDIYGDEGKFSYAVISHKDSAKIHDLFYSDSGVTFDFWTLTPTLSLDPLFVSPNSFEYLSVDGHMYRLFFSCENSGESNQTEYNPDVFGVYDESRVMGYICGIRNIHAVDPTVSSNGILTAGNYSEMEFVFAATIGCNTDGTDSNDWGHSIKIATDSGGNRLEFTYPLSGSSATSNISRKFCHLALSFDFKESLISLYADGDKLTSSGIKDVFSTDRPKFPTFFTPSSQDTSSIHYLSGEAPSLYDQKLTPIILGGGYSDLCPSGFLGANLDTATAASEERQHGYWSNRGIIQRSGLNGYLGSWKVYKRALTPSEVDKNYNAQKAFFKTIQMSNT